MRLIDADEIIKQFDPNTWQGEMMIAIAKGLPTAYDVDKVMERLDNYLFEKHCVEGDGEIVKILEGGGVDE